MTMTSRERVQAVLHHDIPDRVPIIIGVSNATGIKLKPYQAIKKKLNIESEDKYILDWPELGTVLPDERVLKRLRSDVRGIMDRFPKIVYERNRIRPPHSPFIDDWGWGQVEIEPGNWYGGIHPMKEATTIDEIDKYPWPDMDDSFRTSHVRHHALKLHEENQYAIFATPRFMFPFEKAIAMQGMETFLSNMVIAPDFAQELLNRITQLCLINISHFLDQCGDVIDIIKIGDDLGTQENLIISPRMYRKMIKPLHAGLISLIKQKTKAKVFFHTDGDVFNLIEDFIEIGVDILNPIQTSAGKMANLNELKKQFGKHIIFCGGIDSQNILPHSSPIQVKQEVKRVMGILGKNGGYMAASVHTIMNDVPAENILAMVDAVEEFGYYPFSK